jgi:hypothetical protein
MAGLTHKHLIATSARLAAAALLLCGAVLVAPRAHAAEIIPSLGMTSTPNNGDGTNLSYGLAVRGGIVPMLSAEIGMSYRQEMLFDGRVESKQWPITTSLWLKPMPMFYLGGGVGWYNTTLHYPKTPLLASSTSQEFGVHLGGGLTLPIMPGVASVDLNGRYVYLGDQASDLPPNNFKADYWTTSLGVAFHF